MNEHREYISQIIQWLLAASISIIFLNCIVLFYESAPGFLHREGGPTRGIWMPNSFIVKGNEGRSISRIDNNGYINECDNLSDEGYILVMGNSQSNGLQVNADKRYTSLLNTKFQGNLLSSDTYVYNISSDGSDFCDLVSGFSAAIEEFPHTKAVVLQIGGADWSLDKMQNCMEQRVFSEEMRGEYMAEHLSTKQKLSGLIKLLFPFPVYMKEVKMQTIQLDFENAFWHSEKEETKENSIDNNDIWNEYEQSLSEVLEFLRNSYRGEIIILELPNVALVGDGKLENGGNIRQDLFARQCRENDIIYVNMFEPFEQEYIANHILPYGFSNTKPGYGHLSESGHQMIAEILYPLLNGGG